MIDDSVEFIKKIYRNFVLAAAGCGKFYFTRIHNFKVNFSVYIMKLKMMVPADWELFKL